MLLCPLTACGGKDEAITTPSELDKPGHTVGVAMGSSGDTAAARNFHNVGINRCSDSAFRDTEKLYYNNYSDMVEALKQNKTAP